MEVAREVEAVLASADRALAIGETDRALAAYRRIASEQVNTDAVGIAAKRLTYFETSYPVVRVDRGNALTVEAGGRQIPVRLLGVCAEGEPAREFLAELVGSGRVHVVPGDGPKRDDCGRWLAYVHRESDRQSVNLGVIEAGHGWADPEVPHPRATAFAEAEAAAPVPPPSLDRAGTLFLVGKDLEDQGRDSAAAAYYRRLHVECPESLEAGSAKDALGRIEVRARSRDEAQRILEMIEPSR